MYEAFEHTADLGLRIRAPDVDTLFVEAAEALFSIIVDDLGTVRAEQRFGVQLAGEEKDYLLFDWLKELLYRFDTQHMLFSRFEAHVSDAVLNQITSNTAGDLIITGNLAAAEQAFNLTKYFVQILAGVTNMNIVLDPQGSLFFGSKHVVPFDLIDADVYVDVIALCPLPQVLDFQLETPGGTLIRPSTAGAQPNIRYLDGQQVLFYRLTLPALTNDPAGSHAGKWKAIAEGIFSVSADVAERAPTAVATLLMAWRNARKGHRRYSGEVRGDRII